MGVSYGLKLLAVGWYRMRMQSLSSGERIRRVHAKSILLNVLLAASFNVPLRMRLTLPPPTLPDCRIALMLILEWFVIHFYPVFPS